SDSADRLKTAPDTSTRTALAYNYNPLRQVSRITYTPGANSRAFGYNALHQLTSDTLKTGSGATIASIVYGYDLNGNETSKTTTGVTGSTANTYTYDFADRLTSWTSGAGTSTYAYDDSGNRTKSGTQTFTYDARNQLLTGAGSGYTYTPRATLASVTTVNSSVTATSDAFGQTVKQDGQTYAYDALGRTVTSSGAANRTFTYSGMANTLAADGTATYSRDPGAGVSGVKAGTGFLAWIDKHTDVVADFTAGATGLAGSRAYGPLGTVVANANLVGNLGYQSGFTESSTGRVNMGARWYNPNTGQFDNRDIASNSPIPNPANANRYAYGNDNPLTNIDPDGHRAWDTDEKTGKTYFVAPATDGGTDFAWGAPARLYGPHGYRHRGGYTVSATGAGSYTRSCGINAACRQEHHQDLADVKSQLQKQIKADLDRCEARGGTPQCWDAVAQRATHGGYWANVDGNYETIVGGVLITVSPTDRKLINKGVSHLCAGGWTAKLGCFADGAGHWLAHYYTSR